MRQPAQNYQKVSVIVVLALAAIYVFLFGASLSHAWNISPYASEESPND